MEYNGYSSHLIASVAYSLFLINVTCVVFISFIYYFAYRFFSDRFYLIVGTGWFGNAVYLALETYTKFSGSNDSSVDNQFEYLKITISLFSTLLFHYAIYEDKEFLNTIKYVNKFKTIYGFIPIIFCVTGMLYPFVGTSSKEVWFSLVIISTILYSFFVTLLIAYRFYFVFPNENYGVGSILLYGSWGLYAILQLFYMVEVFAISMKPIADLLFGVGWLLKILNVVGLFSVLRKEYSILQMEIHESSVLKDLGDLAAGLHHDIAHPIMMIDADLAVLKQERGNDQSVKKFAENISKPLKMMHAATTFVDLVRLDPEQISQEFKKTNVKTPVELAIGFYKKRFEKSNLRIIYKTDKIPSLQIQATENLLADAFFNIIRNASEASASNIEIRIRRSINAPGNIEFQFFNDGEALSSETIANCFRAGWSSKEQKIEKGNVGMGLYMCSKIIKIHRGKIEIFNLDTPFDLNNEFDKETLSKYKICVRVIIPIARGR